MYSKSEIQAIQEKALFQSIRGFFDCSIFESKERARLDGVLCRGDNVIAAFEAKVRIDYSYDDLAKMGGVLVSAKKLEHGLAISRAMEVPFIIFIRLVPDNLNLYCKVTDKDANVLIKWSEKESRTKQSISLKSTIVRNNAYIDLSSFKPFE